MDCLENKGITVSVVKASTGTIQKFIINPTNKLLDVMKCSSSTSDLKNMTHVYYSLEINMKKLTDLKHELDNENSTYDKTELEEIIGKLEKNIDCLKELMKKHNDSIEKENSKLDLSKIKAQFYNPKEFDLLMNDVTLLYENPEKNLLHGEDIRTTLRMLADQQNSSNLDKLKEHINQRQEDAETLEELTTSFTGAERPKNREELIKIHKSFVNLLKICDNVVRFNTNIAQNTI